MIGPVFTLSHEEPAPQAVVPETLIQCRCHYNPPVKEHIYCPNFGKSDGTGTNGSCWWCMEMTPYQWHMCSDETWLLGLLSPTARVQYQNREEAAKFIEDYKQKNPMGNERRSLVSEPETGKAAYNKLKLPQGHWHDVYQMDDSTIHGVCSVCKKTTILPDGESTTYCCNCGARMVT